MFVSKKRFAQLEAKVEELQRELNLVSDDCTLSHTFYLPVLDSDGEAVMTRDGSWVSYPLTKACGTKDVLRAFAADVDTTLFTAKAVAVSS